MFEQKGEPIEDAAPCDVAVSLSKRGGVLERGSGPMVLH